MAIERHRCRRPKSHHLPVGTTSRPRGAQQTRGTGWFAAEIFDDAGDLQEFVRCETDAVASHGEPAVTEHLARDIARAARIECRRQLDAPAVRHRLTREFGNSELFSRAQ